MALEVFHAARKAPEAKVVFPAPLGPAMIMQCGEERADLLMVGGDSNYSVLMKQGGTSCGGSMFNAQSKTEARSKGSRLPAVPKFKRLLAREVVRLIAPRE